MRGSLQPSKKHVATDLQIAFRTLSRHRRTNLAKAASTTLVKASQWARGDATDPAVASALEQHVQALLAKRK